MPASKSLSTSVRERAGEWGYDFCFTGRASCLRTIRKGSTVTCPTSVLCLENRCRCSSSHSLSPSVCISWGRQAAWSRPKRTIRRYSGKRDHSLLKDFRCCGSILVNNITRRLRRIFFRFRLLSRGGPAMEVVSLVRGHLSIHQIYLSQTLWDGQATLPLRFTSSIWQKHTTRSIVCYYGKYLPVLESRLG